MKNSVFIIIETTLPDLSIFKIEEFMVALMDRVELNGCELSLFFCEKDRIQDLNKNYRNKDKVTDVLSFQQNDIGTEELNSTVLGDIVVATEVAFEQGEEYGTGFISELKRLLIHGLLHLIGYDHVNGESEANKMREYEAVLLEGSGEI